MNRPRVLLLIAGGTSLSPKESGSPRVKSARDVPGWIQELQELSIIADLEPVFLSSGRSAELQSELWTRIVALVARDYKRFDGFILTHDIESVHYTAPALACALDGIGKPFVITASPYDLMRRTVPPRIKSMFDEYRGFGNKDNLLNAFHVAVGDLGETCLVFGNQIHRAIEVSPSRIPSLNYFSSFSGTLLGKVDFGLKLYPPVHRRHSRTVRFRPKFSSQLLTLEIHPGASVSQIITSLTTKPKAVFVKLDELTPLPDEADAELRKLARSGTPVILFREQATNEPRSTLLRLANLPYHTAYAMTVWALGQTNAIPKLRSLLNEQLAVFNRKGVR